MLGKVVDESAEPFLFKHNKIHPDEDARVVDAKNPPDFYALRSCAGGFDG